MLLPSPLVPQDHLQQQLILGLSSQIYQPLRIGSQFVELKFGRCETGLVGLPDSRSRRCDLLRNSHNLAYTT